MTCFELPVEAGKDARRAEWLGHQRGDEVAVPLGELANRIVWATARKMAERRAGETQRSAED